MRKIIIFLILALVLILMLVGSRDESSESQPRGSESSELKQLDTHDFTPPVGGFFDFPGKEIASNIKIAEGSENYFDEATLLTYLEFMGLIENGVYYVIFVEPTRDGAPGLTSKVTLNGEFTGAVHMTCHPGFASEPGGMWGCFINEFRDGRTVAEVGYDSTSMQERDAISWAWDSAVTAYVEDGCEEWDCYKDYLQHVVNRQGYEFVPLSEGTYNDLMNLVEEQGSFIK
jgi:hypothetical protein